MDDVESTILTGRKLYPLQCNAVVHSVDCIAQNNSRNFESFTLQGWVAMSFVLVHTNGVSPTLRPGSATPPAKWVMVTAIIIVELSSLLCDVSERGPVDCWKDRFWCWCCWNMYAD
ncbi:hypothetical protein K438DRAFT_1937257 [Mycena galopus ATCC 62051]|nr:hypothetical protein K438DRAFT_1937257 [Mycena galopus ATCC 62051]